MDVYNLPYEPASLSYWTSAEGPEFKASMHGDGASACSPCWKLALLVEPEPGDDKPKFLPCRILVCTNIKSVKFTLKDEWEERTPPIVTDLEYTNTKDRADILSLTFGEDRRETVHMQNLGDRLSVEIGSADALEVRWHTDVFSRGPCGSCEWK